MTTPPPQDPDPSWPPPPSASDPRGPVPPPADAGLGRLIPTGNPKALLAYYLGLFSLIPCVGLVLGFAGLILGLQGLKFAQESPQVHGKTHAWVGVILSGICGVCNLVGLIFVLISIAASR